MAYGGLVLWAYIAPAPRRTDYLFLTSIYDLDYDLSGNYLQVEDIQDNRHPILLLRLIEKQSFIRQILMRSLIFEVVHTPPNSLLFTDRAQSFLCAYRPLILPKAHDVEFDNLRTQKIAHNS